MNQKKDLGSDSGNSEAGPPGRRADEAAGPHGQRLRQRLRRGPGGQAQGAVWDAVGALLVNRWVWLKMKRSERRFPQVLGFPVSTGQGNPF